MIETTSTESNAIGAWRGALDNWLFVLGDEGSLYVDEAGHSRLAEIEEWIIADPSQATDAIAAKLWVALHAATDNRETALVVATGDLAQLAAWPFFEIHERALVSALIALSKPLPG
jgi:hypothetical protein